MLVRFMVFNATFINISVTSWWSVLLVEETGVPRENTDHIMLCRVDLDMSGIRFELIDNDYISSIKSNHHTITITTAPVNILEYITYSVMTYYWVSNKINTTSATSGAVTVYPSTAPWFTYIFFGLRVGQSFLQLT